MTGTTQHHLHRLSSVSRKICRSTQKALQPFQGSHILASAITPSTSVISEYHTNTDSDTIQRRATNISVSSSSTSPSRTLLLNTTTANTDNTSGLTNTNTKRSDSRKMSTTSGNQPPPTKVDSTSHFPGKTSQTPGEQFEVRQTSSSEDWKPDPSKSLPLSPQRQALIDDIIALYSCKPTIDRVKRYTPDCVYDDQFVYANNRYKMAGQWFALPKLFKESINESYQIVVNDRDLIQFKNEQTWTFAAYHKTTTMTALVSLSLDPETVDGEFIQVKYHKDQADEADYSHKGPGFIFKKFQADNVIKLMDHDNEEIKTFLPDKDAATESVRRYEDGKADAPVRDL